MFSIRLIISCGVREMREEMEGGWREGVERERGIGPDKMQPPSCFITNL